MNTNELIEQLEQRYGNPHAKDCMLIQEAIKQLRFLNDEVKALHAQVQDLKNPILQAISVAFDGEQVK